MARIIKIFLSSPSDVAAEQKLVLALVAEINDVIAFLAPSLDVKLAVLRYQDDVFPDIGKPQDVVDKQIPQDFDIFLGIMWMRCGTPTADAPSGTIHEFRQAMKRREETGRPIIMFYFSDQSPDTLPTIEEAKQLIEVRQFRNEIDQIGLTMVYPDRGSFRERLRGRLLRAVSDLANRAPLDSAPMLTKEASVADLRSKMDDLAKEYDDVRNAMIGSPERTARMTDIFGGMITEAPTALAAFDRLKNSLSAGARLAAIAILRAFPREDQLDWLADRMNPESEKPFIGFQAATAIAQAVRSLPMSADTALQDAIDKAMKFALLNPNDPPRITMLQQAQRELELKRKQS